MDVNFIAPQISAPSAPSEGPSSRTSMVTGSDPQESPPSFSSVLRSARQDRGRPHDVQKKEAGTSPETETRETKRSHADHRASDAHETPDRPAQDSADADEQTTMEPQDSPESPAGKAGKTDAETAAPNMVPVAALLQIAAMTPSDTPEAGRAVPAIPAAQDQHTQPAVPSVPTSAALAPAVGTASGTSASHPTQSAAASSTAGTASPGLTVQSPVPPSPSQVAPGPSQLGTTPAPSPNLAPTGQADASPTFEKRGEDSALVQTPIFIKEEASAQPQKITAEPAGAAQEEHSQAAAVPHVGEPVETTGQRVAEQREQPELRGAQTPLPPHTWVPKDPSDQAAALARPYEWQRVQSSDEPTDTGSFPRDARTQAEREATLPNGAASATVPTVVTGATATQADSAVAVGTAAHQLPRPMESRTAEPPPAVPPQALSHEAAEARTPILARSVVFEVTQPDLGRVNVRVAMTNDLVHTHLSSDRPDVGQYLVNGQDRLQAALQASGLDMGQFRVHVDRQGAQHGGQEWLSRGYDDRPQQQRGQQRPDDTPADYPPDRRPSGVLSLFA